VAVAPDGTLGLTQEAPFVLHLSATGALLDRVRLPGGARFADGIAIDADGVAWAATVSGNSLVEIHP
jgi:sugar lactone lactonase YvrE